MAKFKKKYDTEFHWHELLDRAHCLNVMYEEMIYGHPTSDHPELKERIDGVGQVLQELHRVIAEGRFDRFTALKKK